MSEIVFVLGAGASVHTGAPVMATFLERARLLSRGVTDRPWKEHFDRVFDAINDLQRVHSKAYFDIHNLEAVFTILETGRTIGKLPGYKPEQIPAVLDSFKRVIAYTLDLTTSFPVNDVREPVFGDSTRTQSGMHLMVQPSNDYLRFVQLIEMLRDGRSGINGISIITFNYDIALDFALRSRGVYPDYSLPNLRTEGSTIKLLKLHGSLNWGRATDTGAICCFDRLGKVASDVASRRTSPGMTNLPIGINLQSLIRTRVNTEIEPGPTEVEPVPVIVPPGFYKAEQHEALKEVWQAAASELSQAEDIIVIGFSLPTTDSFFNHLYALGTEGNSTIRKFWVFNPDTEGSVEKRFRDMLGFGASTHFHYFPLSFDMAVNELAFQYYGFPNGYSTSTRYWGQPDFGVFADSLEQNYSKWPLHRSSQVKPGIRREQI